MLGDRCWYAVPDQSLLQGRRQGGGEPNDHQREEDADGQHLGGILERRVHSSSGPPVASRQTIHDGSSVGRREGPHG